MKTPARNAAVILACLTLLTGCGAQWWAVKQVAKETAEDVAESTHLSKTKEELQEDLKELKSKLRTEKEEKARLELRVRELEITCGKTPLGQVVPGGTDR